MYLTTLVLPEPGVPAKITNFIYMAVIFLI